MVPGDELKHVMFASAARQLPKGEASREGFPSSSRTTNKSLDHKNRNEECNQICPCSVRADVTYVFEIKWEQLLLFCQGETNPGPEDTQCKLPQPAWTCHVVLAVKVKRGLLLCCQLSCLSEHNVWKQVHFQNSYLGACYCTVDELSCIYWAVKHAVLFGDKKNSPSLKSCTARTKRKTIQWKGWHWHEFTAENSTFWSCTRPQTVQWKQQSEGYSQCCHPPQRAHFLGHCIFFFFCWHGCTNKLRFIQVRAPGSRCYCCNSARQTAHSLYRPFPPERLCNEGVIGLITLCLPIMLLKWSGLFPNTLWQAGEGGGASSINDTSFNLC